MTEQPTLDRREYQRGYQRGRMRIYHFAARAFQIAHRFREELQTMRRAAYGKDNWMARECHTCERWTRGQPGNCRWGKCSAAFEAAVGEPMMWSDNEVFTHEDFGCVNHLAGNPLRKKLNEGASMREVSGETK